jgi:hypothetical protein
MDHVKYILVDWQAESTRINSKHAGPYMNVCNDRCLALGRKYQLAVYELPIGFGAGVKFANRECGRCQALAHFRSIPSPSSQNPEDDEDGFRID